MIKWKLKRLKEEFSLYTNRCVVYRKLCYGLSVLLFGIHRAKYVVHNPCTIAQSLKLFTRVATMIILRNEPIDDRIPTEYPR